MIRLIGKFRYTKGKYICNTREEGEMEDSVRRTRLIPVSHSGEHSGTRKVEEDIGRADVTVRANRGWGQRGYRS